MAAGIATIKQLLTPEFHAMLEAKTSKFVGQIRDFAASNDFPMRIEQIGSIFWFNFSNDRITKAEQINADGMAHFKVIHQLLLEAGVYLGPSGYEVGFVSRAHTKKDLDYAAQTINKILDSIFK